MEMSNALQKNLMQLFPNKIIYSAELCKNISVHMHCIEKLKGLVCHRDSLQRATASYGKILSAQWTFQGKKLMKVLKLYQS